MSSLLLRRIASLGAAMVLVASPLLVPTAANAAALSCTASVSDSNPKRYSNVYVRVKTAPAATVRTVAHYKTTKTIKRGKANSVGRATLKYYISGATPGYRVKVSVTVTKNGRSRTCATSFTPRR
ncbi:hypothetical protein [Nocardioides limicola]|uniref:hypothetical protein n=1 Tax=Nocardioides limicola TaxID=2803368 RepID=UPI00193B0277|nr:hypothetical protein [Nocardioides sp. DJM-14]